jgi:hypothetical protein
MKCFWCLVEYQRNETDDVRDAHYVYDGKSCCLRHVNGIRGLPVGFGRYPLTAGEA